METILPVWGSTVIETFSVKAFLFGSNSVEVWTVKCGFEIIVIVVVALKVSGENTGRVKHVRVEAAPHVLYTSGQLPIVHWSAMVGPLLINTVFGWALPMLFFPDIVGNVCLRTDRAAELQYFHSQL